MPENWAALSRKILNKSAVQGIPVIGSFELTSRCNFHCKMCYVCRNANDMAAMNSELTADEWIRIGEQACKAGLFYLTLTGGEVFIRKDFRKIYEALSQMGLRIVIYTNGSLITREIAAWLKGIPPALVSITLYGASSETYERITGNAAGFRNTLNGLDALMSAGIVTGVKMTPVQGNYKEFEQLLELSEGYNKGLGFTSYISPRREGEGTDPEGNRLSPEEAVDFEEIALSYNKSSDEKTDISLDNDIYTQSDNAATEQINENNDSAFRCYAGRAGFWVTYDGRLTPCGLLNIPEENLLENDFLTAWESLKLGCKAVPKCETCISCSYRKYCKVCPGRLMTETGGFEKPADYLCKMARYKSIKMISSR